MIYSLRNFNASITTWNSRTRFFCPPLYLNWSFMCLFIISIYFAIIPCNVLHRTIYSIKNTTHQGSFCKTKQRAQLNYIMFDSVISCYRFYAFYLQEVQYKLKLCFNSSMHNHSIEMQQKGHIACGAFPNLRHGDMKEQARLFVEKSQWRQP